jgi:hypothetical protein
MRRQREFISRAGKKMMRFDSPTSNTELKLKYGTTNLENISEYEENFFQFNYALNGWAEALLEAGDESAAEQVLYGGVLCGVETAKTYTMLADIYFKYGKNDEMQRLYDAAENKYMPAQDKVLRYIVEHIDRMGIS